MSELKITKGTFHVCDDIFVENEDGLTVLAGTCGQCSEDEKKANAILFAETLNVANQTGLTPRQLLEQRDRLLEIVKGMKVCWENDGKPTCPTSWHSHAVAAIAKAEGRS
ncbi:hypothetical protein [Rosistilla oblonga]|uniref:hypothetical protein n=1 Tax=Rosistilla oblonga TaxID=2527990 RepID=UPI003A974B7E